MDPVLEATNMNLELLKAATSGETSVLEAVFRENIDICQQTTPIKDTSIHVAAGLGHLEVIKRIHSRWPSLFTKVNSLGDTALHKAARAGHSQVLKFLMECARTYMNSQSPDIESGSSEVTNILRKGNRDGDTIMHEAVRSNQLEMVKLLIGEDPQLLCIVNDVGESPLHMAVEKGDISLIEEILISGKYSSKGPNGRTTLHAAVIQIRPDITKLLLKKNPELVNEIDHNKRTPLHFASGLGLPSYVQMLMECDKTKPCLLDKYGSAPIHMSAHFGELKVVKIFIKFRPDIKDLLDGDCKNILHIAIKSQQVHVIKYILKDEKLGDLLNGKDKDGNTPLHQAAITGNPYIVNLLVKHKRVTVTTFNQNQQSALDVARSQLEEESKEDAKDNSLVLATLVYASSSPWCHHKTLRREMIRLGENNAESIESCKSKGNIMLLVATLVATVTFTAGFTPPGATRLEDTKVKGHIEKILPKKTGLIEERSF